MTQVKVMDRLAQVFGAEWVRKPDADAEHFELRRHEAVQRWLSAWRQRRTEAELSARDFQRSVVRQALGKALVALDHPIPLDADGREVPPPDIGSIPLARLVRSLAPRQVDQLVDHIARISPVRSGGEARSEPPPLVMRAAELTDEQWGWVRAWLSGGQNTPPPADSHAGRLWAQLDKASVAFGSRGGIQISVELLLPSEDTPYGTSAVGARASALKMEQVLQEDLLRRMGARDTPAGALLGATITPRGRVEPAVRAPAAAVPLRPLSQISANPMAAELLPALAEGCGWNLVADYHTRSIRLPDPPEARTVADLLSAAADRYQMVFRQEAGFLLARHRYWPDRDEEETPAPYPVRWLSAKKATGSLSLDDFLLLGCLTDTQLDGLASYVDGPLSLRNEVAAVRRHRWVSGFLAGLSETERQNASGEEGLPLSALDLRRRTFLVRSVNQPAAWDKVRLYLRNSARAAPGTAHRLQVMFLVAPGASVPVWYFSVPGAFPSTP